MTHSFPTRRSADLGDIVDYVRTYPADSPLALETARYCLIDTLGCGLEALEYPACTKLLGPVVPGAPFSNGAKVPGTSFQLDPVQAAFNLGAKLGRASCRERVCQSV